ncbi:MAG: hypothetical protein WCA20_09835 [Candidatus Sulfotelmatobacter sp.]
MVDLSFAGGNLVLHVRGADKLWAFKSSLEIPLVHIAEIRVSTAAKNWSTLAVNCGPEGWLRSVVAS